MPNLVGIGNSQVPTNSMLGGLAYQDPAHANLTSVEIENIAAIKARTTDNATSVFIYDTSKDSDGGAWRKRTQDASWYNEGPSVYRGARKEFPAIAVLVAEAQKLTIYDGDDPNLSMWMVFISDGYGQSASNVIQANGTALDIKDIHMLNGQLVVAQSQGSDSYGSPVINFISERAVRMDPNTSEGGRWMGNISQRNTNQEWYQYQGYVVGSSEIHCCTQFVDPHAYVDKDTGLPRPTIFLGCKGSMTQIHSDETVDTDTNPPGSAYTCISMTDVNSKGQVVCVYNNGNVVVTYLYNLEDKVDPEEDPLEYYYYNAAMNTWPSLRWYPGSEKVCWVDDDKLALVNGAGVQLYLGGRDNVSSGTRTFAYLNKDFPTGYLTNVNPVATCASTSTESLTASTQLLSNGTFASNITGWTDKSSGASNIAHDSSNQRMTMNGNAATARAHTTITTVVGEWYMVWTKPISSLFSGTTHTLEMYVGTHEYPNGNYSYIGQSVYTHGTSDANEPIAITWKAAQTTYHILFQTGHDKAIDNVYAMRVAEDVSSNNPMLDNGNGDFYVSGQPLDRGFRVFGTVARTPAATGSEIVTYNFGNGSYLEQPYNSELNFLQNAGNSFTAMAWASPKVTQTGGSPWHPLISLEHWDGSNTDWYCGAHGKMAFSGTEIGNTVLEANQLYFLVWTRNGPTGTNYVYVNGRLDGSNTSPDPVAASNQTLLIGCRHTNGQKSTDTGGSVTDGSHWNKVALVRISQGYTEATMINKIYNEERKLFHPNAKCTLGMDGGSNLNRGVSYDKDTGLMHVLNVGSRNDFNGLVMINKVARGSGGVAGHRCISSVNGMIVEEE